MKKAFFLLLVALLMVGCGGGGGTTSSSDIPGGGAGGGGGTVSGPVGYITVSFPGPAAPETLVPVRAGGLATIAGLRDHFRLVVRQMATVQFLDEEGNLVNALVETRRYIADNTVPGSLRMAVSPGDGYTAEVLTYHQSGSVNNMLEYAISNVFAVVSGADTAVSMALIPVSQYITMTAPDNVVSGLSYSVSTSKTVPLRSQYYLSQFESTALWPTITNFVAGYGSPGAVQRTLGAVSFTAPTVLAQSRLYLQGQFFIDDSLLSAAERAPTTPPAWSNWRINCPDPAYTDNVSSTLLLPGTISIIINP
jgi:hypothetical protein